MSQIGLSDECKKLELTIENLTTGKEKCEMDTSRSLEEIVDYLRGYLNELKDLNCKIIENGNTPELLKEVYDKYSELWMFQAMFRVNSIADVVKALWHYGSNDK